MKALSIKQPWAFAICNLPDEFKKDIENRTWNTKHRGDFLVHASKGFDAVGYERLCEYLSQLGYTGNIPTKKEFVYGSIVGITSLNAVVNNHDIFYADTDSIWYEGYYGFMLERTKAFENAIPLKGRLNFFNVDDSLVREELYKTIVGDRNADKIPQQNFTIGDIVVCRPESFDVITKFSIHTPGMKIFYREGKISAIENDMCRFDDFGLGYSWYNKKDLILKDDYHEQY